MPSPMGKFSDGIANLISRLGTGADRNTQSGYYVPLLSQQQIEAAYRSSWLTRKTHDLLPFEMTRAGRDWQATKEQIEALENAETALDLWGKIRRALFVARLHGGAAIVLGVRQGSPEMPLVVDRVGRGQLRFAVVCSRHQLTAPMGLDYDPESEFYLQPAMYEMRTARRGGIRVHPSRVIPFHGAPLPDGAIGLSALDVFWGDPLLLAMKSAIDNAETAQAAVATLLHELKSDVITMPGLIEQIGTEEGEARVALRIAALTKFRSMFNATLLEGGDGGENPAETLESRQISFQQHPELVRQFIGIVAGAAGIPVTRLLGEAAGGLNSTGKGEADDFDTEVGARQTAEITPALARIDEVLLRSTLGSRPAEVTYEFASRRPTDENKDSEREKREAETVQIYHNTGLIPSTALAEAAANRLIESGRWPGLDKAIEEAEAAGDIPGEPGEVDPAPDDPLDPAAQAAAMETAGTITRDMALSLIVDAAPRSLYVQRKVLNAAAILAHARKQGLEPNVPPDELHVTIARSRAPVDWFKVDDASWYGENDGSLRIRPGGARMVEYIGDKALALHFASSSLSYRHEEIVRAGATWDFPEYQPHISLRYDAPAGLDLRNVEPWRGEILLGPEIFEEFVDGWRP